jgi:hypothetical protein
MDRPDRLNGELRSDTETFRQLATVAVTGTWAPAHHTAERPLEQLAEGGTL